MNELQEYLIKRKVTDSNYLNNITELNRNKENFRLFLLNGHEYMVSHFFDNSNRLGFDLMLTNSILQTEDSNMVAIAAVEGDDVICIKANENSVWLWFIQSGSGELEKISNTFKEFLQKICN